MKSRIHETIFGIRIEYPEPDQQLSGFLEQVEKASASKKVTEDELVALVHSDANPLLKESPAGRRLVTKETLADPVYRVLLDFLERKRIDARGLKIEKLKAGYTLSVPEAAQKVGLHENAIRSAIQLGRLAAVYEDGRYWLHPKWLAQYVEASSEGEKRGPKTAPAARAGRAR